MTQEILIRSIEELKARYEEIRGQVTDLSQKMRAEKGLENAVALIREAVGPF